jgi:shikimate 5-dehydrogenase
VDHSRSPQTHLPHLQKIEPRSLFLRLNAPSESAFRAFWTLLPELRAAAVTKPAKLWAGALGSATNPEGTPLPMNSLRRQGATFTCDNTDAVALRHFLKNFGTPGDVVRVIGYGALGQTAVACALQEGFRVQVVNRSRVKAPMPEGVDFLPWTDLGGGQADLLIQASAYGMGEFPSEAEAPPALFPPFPQGARALLESVYHPAKTATLRSAEQSGLAVMDGLTFFSLQAEAQRTFFLQSLSLKGGVDE